MGGNVAAVVGGGLRFERQPEESVRAFRFPFSIVCSDRRTLTSPWLKKKHTAVTIPPSRLPLEGREQKRVERDEVRRRRSSAGPWRVPEIRSEHEEEAHHHAVQQEHAGDVEIRRVAQT